MSPQSAFRRRPARRFLALSIVTLAGTALLPQVHAATETWTGATSNLWNDGTNWTGPNLPPISGDSLNFGPAGAAGGLLLNNNLTDATFSIAGFTFNATADAYVIGNGTATVNAGNPFILSGDILNSSTNLETINDPFSMAATRTFTNSVATGSLALNGVISGAGGFTAAGLGTTTLSQTNTYTGNTIVNGGTLVLAIGGGSGTIRGTLTINTGGTVTTSAVNALGYNTGTSVTTVNIVGGILNDTAVGDQGFNQTYNLTGGTMQSNGGTSNLNATQLFAFGSATVVNSLASANSSTIAGKVVLRNDAGAHSQLFTVAEGTAPNDLVVSAALVAGGSGTGAVGITKAGPGTMLVTGAGNFAGNVTVNAGLLTAATNVNALGAYAAGRTFTVNAGATLAMNVNNLTTGLAGATTPAIVINGGTVSATRYNSSGNSATNNGLTLQNGGTLSLSSTTDGTAYSSWQFGDLVTSSGTSPSLIVGTGAIEGKANLYNGSNGGTTFNVSSTGSTTDLNVADILGDAGPAGPASGAGSLKKTGAGTLLLSGANIYTGGTTVSAGTLALNNNSSLGTGALTMAGGTLQLRGVVNSISVSFVGNGANTAAATFYGVVPVVGANFNNFTGATQAAASGALKDSQGNTTAATLTFNANGGSYGTASANQLLNGYLDNQSATGNQNVTVSNLGFSSYSVYAYFGSDVAGRTGSVKVGSTTYYYSTTGAVVGYLPTSSTAAATSPYANFALFNGLSGSTLSLDQFRGSNSSGLNGLQIVSDTSLPQTLANAFTVTADTTVDVTGPVSSALTGVVTIGTNTLNVTGGSTGANTAYGLSLGGTGGLTLTGSPTFNVQNNGTALGSLTLGAIGASANGLTKIGPGTLLLPGANAYTGPTNVTGGTATVSGSLSGTSGVTVTGGTLILAGLTESAANPGGSVNNSATVALGGGASASTLTLTGTAASPQSETLGNLTLSANSVIDFGGIDAASANTTNALTFNSLAILAGSGFSILHWTGSPYSGTSTAETGTPAQDRLLFTSMPTESLANQLSFFGDNGAALGSGHVISYGGGYEIVPIPEPSVIYSALLAVGMVGLRERRRLRALRIGAAGPEAEKPGRNRRPGLSVLLPAGRRGFGFFLLRFFGFLAVTVIAFSHTPNLPRRARESKRTAGSCSGKEIVAACGPG